MEGLPETDILERDKCLLVWNTASRMITNYSEGDAASRVLALLLAIMVNIPPDSSFKMKCQPTIKDYRSFTDYMIEIASDRTDLIIEVKNVAVNTLLSIPSVSVAQVLREAHCYLYADSKRTKVLFVLTNALQWGFGMAKKKEQDKISVEWTFNMFINSDSDVNLLYRYLKNLFV